MPDSLYGQYDFRRHGISAYYRQRVARREQRQRQRDDGELGVLFERVFSRDNLYRTFKLLRAENGPSPGVDGITYDDVSPVELGQLAGAVSSAVLNGTYKPHDVRTTHIPKRDTPERRMLRLRTITDRMVSKALADALSPFWEPLYRPESWGFRKRRCPLRMLAHMEATMHETGRFVIAIDDVERAFDNVPITQAINAHAELFERQPFNRIAEPERGKLLQLIETILKGHDEQRIIGIDQGCPYSPTALNVLLQLELDEPLIQSGTSLLYRYADNLAFVCSNVPEGHASLAQSGDLLNQLHMSLKGKPPGTATDLQSGQHVDILGVDVCLVDGNLIYSPGSNAWDELESRLEESHESPNPLSTALAVMSGWVDAWGWTLETSELEEVTRRAIRYGFPETDPVALWGDWGRSRGRWQRTRTQYGTR